MREHLMRQHLMRQHLMRQHVHRAGNESGFAIIPAIFLAVVAIGIVFNMAMTSFTSDRAARNEQLALQTRYLAQGAIEIGKKAIQDATARGMVPPAGGTATIDGIAVPYTINAVGLGSVQVDASGFQTTTQGYEVAATASLGGVRSPAHRVVNAMSMPMFQYAVFFEQSLDILPTPNMVLTGRVHTNGDLRLGCNSATLTLDSNHVRVVGDVRRWKKHSNVATVGNVRVRKWVADPFDPAEPEVYEDMESRDQMTSLGISTTTGYDSLFAGYDQNSDGDFDDVGDWLPFDAGSLERYSEPAGYGTSGNTLKAGAHGVTRATPPPIDSLAKFEPAPSGGDYVYDGGSGEYVSVAPGTGTHQKGFFHASADVQIIVSESGGSWQAYDSADFDITSQLSGAVTIDQTYDERQGGYVPVAKIDVAALNASSVFPSNGLLYVSHYGMGTGTNSKGVHLVNGSQVGADLTVVTEGPAYIEGDFNTNTPVSAAVLCDAINLLSNSWVNGPAEPTASDTTYNVALVIGNTETETSQYNGGLENFPRFHENWSGVTCTVLGSMISIWDNQFATEPISGARYSPPIRD